ncbi:MAG: acetyltransferase [Acidobacteriota bacterium]|nr:acetyltransferase [Acidobacteriota bacterium]
MNIEIQALTTDQQFRDAVALQKTVWGFEDIELLPVRLFVVATKVGGQVFGAYDGAYDSPRMVAFCLAIPGMKAGGRSYLHSHMLGVAPEYRNAGIGRLLKLRQREDALARPVDLIEWTFDPLEIKNAWFNMERLGAIVRRYVHNQYGTTSSHLHGGLPTDRCTAEWWIDSARVNALLNGKPLARPAIEARIPVPAAISTIRLRDPKQARAIQREIGRQFLEYFDRGLAVIGFERTEGEGTYLLGRCP